MEEYDSKVKGLQEEVNRIEAGITNEENRWKQIRTAIEEKENLLERLFEESNRKRSEAEGPSTLEDLNEKFASEEKRRTRLQDEINTGKKDKVCKIRKKIVLNA